MARLFLSHKSVACAYGTFLLLYEVRFLRELLPPLHPVLIFWAVLVVSFNFLSGEIRQYKKFYVMAVAFAGSALITVVLRAPEGLVPNGKAWVLSVLPLLVFLPVFFFVGTGERDKTFLQILLGPSIVIFLASATALVMYLARFGGVVSFAGYERVVGIALYDVGFGAKAILLYGLYADTNHAAVYALSAAAYSIALFFACRNGVCRSRIANRLGMIYAGVNLVIQSFYFPLANSRGGWLSLEITLGVVAALWTWNKSCRRIVGLGRVLLCGGTAVVSVFLVCALLVGMRTEISEFSIWLAEKTNNQTGVIPGYEGVQIDDPGSRVDSFTKEEAGIGSGRLVIWEEALEIYRHYPVFGVNPSNTAYYAKEYLGIGKLAKGNAVHNSFLDLLLDYGAVGALLLLALFGCMGWRTLSGGVKRHLTDSGYFTGVAICFFCGGASVFLSCVFVNTTAMYFLLCLSLNYALAKSGADNECFTGDNGLIKT